ncbi:hypothetical protein [Chryseobacterium schmidteae]|uniref:hypothetical protein n=1 Tax=Chryseobacterium schmidteae TaxID=2730404 RepID=UPI00158E3C5E|nr:hypothetical protein [Chryseobacterium schmidteae]
MKNIKKLLRKDLSKILGGAGSGCHTNGDSAYCWTDCECTFGKACEMNDDGNPGQCVAVGGGGGGGGTPYCPPGDDRCTDQPY